MADPKGSRLTPGDHTSAMRLALSLATKSPCLATNYRVGALIVNSSSGEIVATGYTLELPGNTHAEECCLLKLSVSLASSSSSPSPALESLTDDQRVAELPEIMTGPHALYTTVEPCCLRLSGKTPCLRRILAQKSWITTVGYGFREPDVFVKGNSGLRELEMAGVEVVHVPGLEEEIQRVAMEGHQNPSRAEEVTKWSGP